MANITIPELSGIAEKLEVIHKAIIDNNSLQYLSAEKLAEKLDMTPQTLSALAKEGIIKKYRLGGRKIYYSIPEIYQAIKEGIVNEYSTKNIKD